MGQKRKLFLTFLLLIANLVVGTATSRAQNKLTASFNLTEIRVDQSAGLVQIPITLSGSHSSSVYVYGSVRDGTAYDHTDYDWGSDYLNLKWSTTGTATKYINIPIYRTGAHEDRFFQMVIESSSDANIGTPFNCNVIINGIPIQKPTIRIASATVNAKTRLLTVRGSATGDLAIVSTSVKINNVPMSTSGLTNWSARKTIRIPKRYVIEATTTDSAGNTATATKNYYFR